VLGPGAENLRDRAPRACSSRREEAQTGAPARVQARKRSRNYDRFKVGQPWSTFVKPKKLVWRRGPARPERGSATRSKLEPKIGVVKSAASRTGGLLRVIDPRSEKASGRRFPPLFALTHF
jgi:hypothetical protein